MQRLAIGAAAALVAMAALLVALTVDTPGARSQYEACSRAAEAGSRRIAREAGA